MTMELKETTSMSSTSIHLLDERWFSKNILSPKSKKEANIQENPKTPTICKVEPSPLHRMPRLSTMEVEEEEEAHSFSKCNPKLRHSLSSLDTYRSESSSKGKKGQPRYIKLECSERYMAIQHYINKEAYYRKIFKEKKWRSQNDIEYIELQGYKDLGFVNDKKSFESVKKSAPAIFASVDWRSKEDMKVQLKFWARAVACNAKEEL